MTVTVYTDASHSEKERISTCGYVVLINGKMVKHTILFVGNSPSPYFAEFFAATQALQHCFLLNNVQKIFLHSDCVSISHCNHKRNNKRKLFFISELLETVELIREYGVEVELLHVHAHGINKHNNFIDHSCRNQLRKFIKNKYNEKIEIHADIIGKRRQPLRYYRSYGIVQRK